MHTTCDVYFVIEFGNHSVFASHYRTYTDTAGLECITYTDLCGVRAVQKMEDVTKIKMVYRFNGKTIEDNTIYEKTR